MMLKDGTGEVEDGTAKTGVVKNQDGRCLVMTHRKLVGVRWMSVNSSADELADEVTYKL